jgi:NitT/TauT family transport system permease protein
MEPRASSPFGLFGAALPMLALLAVWEVGALTASSRLFPTPLNVLAALWTEASQGPLAYNLAVTFARVAASFALAMAIGVILGYACGRSPASDRWLRPWLVVFLNIPALVIIIAAYVALGLTESALLVAIALNKVPGVAVTIREGTLRLDRDLAEVGSVFRFGPWSRFRNLLLPQLAPYLLVASRNGLSLVWKIILVAEFLGRSDGVGFALQTAFQNFDMDRIMVYATVFVAVVLVLEYGVLAPMERRLQAWRR